MSSISVTNKYIAVAKNLLIDLYDYTHHKIIEVPSSSKPQEDDRLSDITISADNKYLAAITSVSKQLILFELPVVAKPILYSLPRSASRIRFTVNNSHILVADKTGDVIYFDLNTDDKGTKLLGHLSLLLDILQTNDGNFIITSDRDEKIKVSCYPNTYNIQTFCLGHREFVNHIELMPHNDDLLLSSSGDGTVKVWEYRNGNLCCTINAYSDIEDVKLIESFSKKMDDEGIEVESLPIVHLAVTKLNNETSLLAVSVLTYNALLIYSITNAGDKLQDKLETKLKLDNFPTAIQFHDSTLFLYYDSDSSIFFYKCKCSNGSVVFEDTKIEKVFENVSDNEPSVENHFDSIKVLYKRKFDNVQEYLDRKKLRLEKCNKEG